jgi:hypothetical protein
MLPPPSLLPTVAYKILFNTTVLKEDTKQILGAHHTTSRLALNGNLIYQNFNNFVDYYKLLELCYQPHLCKITADQKSNIFFEIGQFNNDKITTTSDDRVSFTTHPVVWHFKKSRQDQQQQHGPLFSVRLALQLQEVIEGLLTHPNQFGLDQRPVLPPAVVAVHLEQNPQRTRQTVSLLLQEIRLSRPFVSRFPQQISLLVVQIERFSEPATPIRQSKPRREVLTLTCATEADNPSIGGDAASSTRGTCPVPPSGTREGRRFLSCPPPPAPESRRPPSSTSPDRRRCCRWSGSAPAGRRS